MATRANKTRTDIIVVAVLWTILTGLGWWWISTTNMHPLGASTNAEIGDEAFDILMYLAMPVTTFVLIMLGYSVLRFRTSPDDAQDSAPVRSNKIFVTVWIVISVVLSVYVIFNPGFSGLDALAADQDEDMVIEVTAQQWSWDFRYVDDDLEITGARDLVLPSDTRILFKITSLDVIHSFWIPAFRIKKDAVPGLVTEIYMTATETGDFAGDDGFRTQCAELCGTGHARMRTTVTVLDPGDFETWLEETKAEGVSG